MGEVIVLLTRRMGERLTYGISARYPVVWEACSSTVGTPVPKILLLVVRVCTAASLLW